MFMYVKHALQAGDASAKIEALYTTRVRAVLR